MLDTSYMIYNGGAAIWEEGGAVGPTGHVVLVADSEGGPKFAELIDRDTNPCGLQALVKIEPGDHHILATRDAERVYLTVYRVVSIGVPESPGRLAAVAQILHSADPYTGDLPLSLAHLKTAADTAAGKTRAQGCRSAHYIAQRFIRKH